MWLYNINVALPLSRCPIKLNPQASQIQIQRVRARQATRGNNIASHCAHNAAHRILCRDDEHESGQISQRQLTHARPPITYVAPAGAVCRRPPLRGREIQRATLRRQSKCSRPMMCACHRGAVGCSPPPPRAGSGPTFGRPPSEARHVGGSCVAWFHSGDAGQKKKAWVCVLSGLRDAGVAQEQRGRARSWQAVVGSGAAPTDAGDDDNDKDGNISVRVRGHVKSTPADGSSRDCRRSHPPGRARASARTKPALSSSLGPDAALG
jgi:hypothetical protein